MCSPGAQFDTEKKLFYLFYTGATPEGTTGYPPRSGGRAMDNLSAQGVAVSASPYGPWTRLGVVAPGGLAWGAGGKGGGFRPDIWNGLRVDSGRPLIVNNTRLYSTKGIGNGTGIPNRCVGTRWLVWVGLITVLYSTVQYSVYLRGIGAVPPLSTGVSYKLCLDYPRLVSTDYPTINCLSLPGSYSALAVTRQENTKRYKASSSLRTVRRGTHRIAPFLGTPSLGLGQLATRTRWAELKTANSTLGQTDFFTLTVPHTDACTQVGQRPTTLYGCSAETTDAPRQSSGNLSGLSQT